MIIGMGLCFHFRFLIVPEGLILNSERKIGSGDRLELLDLLLNRDYPDPTLAVSFYHLRKPRFVRDEIYRSSRPIRP
jgi:hypothetical protein